MDCLRWLGLAAWTMLVLGARPGLAAVGPVAGLAWVEYPKPAHAERGKVLSAQFPDWDDAALLKADYTESAPFTGATTGFLTCRSRDLAYLAVLYYSPQGLAYPVYRQLPSPPQSTTTLTIDYPEGEHAGLVRLILWRQQPTADWINLLATQPNWTGEPVPGVVSERWFTRPKKATAATWPWIDPWRPRLQTPIEFLPELWPAAQAQVADDLTVQAKDCAILFSGTPSYILDQSGAHGLWPLSWGADLTLLFEVADPEALAEAKLYLYAAPETPLGATGHPPPEQILELTANGQWIPSYEFANPFGTITQPIAVSLSQYLVAGENRVRVRVTAFSTAGLSLSQIVLWTR